MPQPCRAGMGMYQRLPPPVPQPPPPQLACRAGCLPPLQEAGIDMGGLLKEFLESVVAEGFDPNRGLFSATPDSCAYPNPLAGGRAACLSSVIDRLQQDYSGAGLATGLYGGVSLARGRNARSRLESLLTTRPGSACTTSFPCVFSQPIPPVCTYFWRTCTPLSRAPGRRAGGAGGAWPGAGARAVRGPAARPAPGALLRQPPAGEARQPTPPRPRLPAFTIAGAPLLHVPQRARSAALPPLCRRAHGAAATRARVFGLSFAAPPQGRWPLFDELQALDPEVYRSLMRLKRYDGDVADLCLDFSGGRRARVWLCHAPGSLHHLAGLP